MYNYLKMLGDILDNGIRSPDRTGVGTLSLFAPQPLRFNLQAGFPLLTTKELNTHAIVTELLWMIRGRTNIEWLNDHGVHIWDKWADANGSLGPIYGCQWRGLAPDQLGEAIRLIKEEPSSRRIIIDSWEVERLSEMKLTPCHCLVQFYCRNNKLSCHVYIRSSDVFLGLPFNIASYALLTRLIATITNTQAESLIVSFGDAHLYLNHINQAKEQLTRIVITPPPQLAMHKPVCSLEDLEQLEPEDIVFTNYNPHPAIKVPIAV